MLCGDWDGDGDDTPGTYRRADRTWHLRNVHAGGPADWTYPFGRSSDAPLAGDWDGDGHDEPLLARSPAPAPPEPARPGNPGDNSVDCADFATWPEEAQAWFERYYPLYGDVAALDRDNDLIACETLPGPPDPTRAGDEVRIGQLAPARRTGVLRPPSGHAQPIVL